MYGVDKFLFHVVDDPDRKIYSAEQISAYEYVIRWKIVDDGIDEKFMTTEDVVKNLEERFWEIINPDTSLDMSGLV